MRLIKSTLLLFTMTASVMVNAAIINIGDISYDNTQNFMTDTQTSVQYSSLDATLGLTYNDLVLAMQSGGAWDGWSFATSKESDDLINALFQSTTPCTGAVFTGTFCGDLVGWTDGVLGNSFGPVIDAWAYLSTYTTPDLPFGSDIGQVQIKDRTGYGRISDYDDSLSFADFELYTQSKALWPAGFLLYKNTDVSASPVPAPPTIVLFVLGSIFLLSSVAKKRNR